MLWLCIMFRKTILFLARVPTNIIGFEWKLQTLQLPGRGSISGIFFANFRKIYNPTSVLTTCQLLAMHNYRLSINALSSFVNNLFKNADRLPQLYHTGLPLTQSKPNAAQQTDSCHLCNIRLPTCRVGNCGHVRKCSVPVVDKPMRVISLIMY